LQIEDEDDDEGRGQAKNGEPCYLGFHKSEVSKLFQRQVNLLFRACRQLIAHNDAGTRIPPQQRFIIARGTQRSAFS